MYVVFLEQRKRTEMWRVSWVGGCGGRELPWQMKRCHHWKCAGAWSFFFLSPDVHGCRWGIAKPYSIRSRLKERICWEVHFSQMRANPHFRDGRSLDKAVADMALPSADNGFTLWGYRRNRESALEWIISQGEEPPGMMAMKNWAGDISIFEMIWRCSLLLRMQISLSESQTATARETLVVPNLRGN